MVHAATVLELYRESSTVAVPGFSSHLMKAACEIVRAVLLINPFTLKAHESIDTVDREILHALDDQFMQGGRDDVASAR